MFGIPLTDKVQVYLMQYAATGHLKKADEERIAQKMKLKPDMVLGWLHSPMHEHISLRSPGEGPMPQLGDNVEPSKVEKLVYFEIYPELSGVVISDREGEPLLELTARESKGKMYCFSTLICDRKVNGDICFNEAMPGNTKCLKHSNPNIGRKPGQQT
ncbi:MAG: hypothetical protein J5U19_10035 [Candidatus Methanoperedens sp.]|nr:hypothetical protein [Candidatus Methanoperedens sp.]